MDYTLFEKVRDIIVKRTGIPAENILPTSTLSIRFYDRVMIGMDIRNAFDIFVPLTQEETLSIKEFLIYLETQIEEKEEKARIAALKGRVDEFTQKLKNGEIEFTDIPPEICLDVLPNVMDTLPVPVLSKVVKLLKSEISDKKQLLELKMCELEDRKQTLQKIKEDLKDT